MGDARKGSVLMKVAFGASPHACPLLLTERSWDSCLTSRGVSLCVCVCNIRDNCARPDSSPLSGAGGCVAGISMPGISEANAARVAACPPDGRAAELAGGATCVFDAADGPL